MLFLWRGHAWSDVAGACSSGDSVPANPVGDPKFPNCANSITVAVGTVNLSKTEDFNCSSDGSLSSGGIKANIAGVNSSLRFAKFLSNLLHVALRWIRSYLTYTASMTDLEPVGPSASEIIVYTYPLPPAVGFE